MPVWPVLWWTLYMNAYIQAVSPWLAAAKLWQAQVDAYQQPK